MLLFVLLFVLLFMLLSRMGTGRSTEAFLPGSAAGAGVWTGNCSAERMECGGTGGAGREPSPLAGKAFADGSCGTEDACDKFTDLGGDLGDTTVTNGGLEVGEVGLAELGRWIKADLGRSFRGVTGGPTALLRCCNSWWAVSLVIAQGEGRGGISREALPCDPCSLLSCPRSASNLGDA